MGSMDTNGANPYNQISWRFRNDDGVETLDETDGGATWIAALNTDITRAENDYSPFRFRWCVLGKASASNTHSIYFAKGGAAYSEVLDTGNWLQLANSDYTTDNANTTDYVVSGNGEELDSADWAVENNAGMIESPNPDAGPLVYPSGQTTRSEFEVVLTLVDNVFRLQDGDYIRLRGYFNNSSYDTYTELEGRVDITAAVGGGAGRTPYPYQERVYGHNLRR
jgi:hypothetical protein